MRRLRLGVRRAGAVVPSFRAVAVAGISAFVALTLGGCGRDAGPGGADWLTSRAQPVNLELTLDTGSAVSRVIGARGGTLIATGADGTRYRLRIPEGALPEGTVITMSPVATAAGLPLGGGHVAAVHLEPDGLRLRRAGTLTIMPAVEVPVQEQVAYAYFGAGRDAHRYPLALDPERIEMQIHHFSGYGFGRAAPNDPGRILLQRAVAHEARLSARLAEAVARDRDAAESTMSEATRAVVWQAHVEYYDVVLRPIMRTAENDDRMASCCLQRYHQWERGVVLLSDAGADGVDDPALPPALVERRVEAAASSARILRNALEQGMQRAIRQCREDAELPQIVTMLELARQASLLELPGHDALDSEVWEHVRRCLTFEVEFRSAFDNRAPENTRFIYELAAVVPVQLDLRDEPGELGSAPLVYERLHASGNPKEAVAGRDGRDPRRALFDMVTSSRVSASGSRPGRFTVHALRWAYGAVDRPGTNCDGADVTVKRDSVVDMTVVFSPGEPVELTRHVPRIGSPFVVESNAWLFHWSQAHGDREIGGSRRRDEEGDRVYAMTLDQVAAGEWRITFDDPGTTELGYSLEERGHLIIRHTPQ